MEIFSGVQHSQNILRSAFGHPSFPSFRNRLSGILWPVPLLILVAVALLAPLVAILLTPLGLVQRYRAGTARRVARRWLAALNVAVLALSTVLFFAGAAATSFWVPNALHSSLAGFAGGCLLGLLGLALTQWEHTARARLYTPNRYLVLALTLLVTARLAYGVWRLWTGWSQNGDAQSWLREAGVPGSLAVGALVLGYSLSYWLGLTLKSPSRVNHSR
jgi:hypothetical protein